jgi:antirestriction protein ArdC
MAPHRLGRDTRQRFDKHARAAEERVDKISGAILGAHLNLPPAHLHDHAASIGHWKKHPVDDKRAFLSAAAQAQTAIDRLLAKSPPPAQT